MHTIVFIQNIPVDTGRYFMLYNVQFIIVGIYNFVMIVQQLHWKLIKTERLMHVQFTSCVYGDPTFTHLGFNESGFPTRFASTKFCKSRQNLVVVKKFGCDSFLKQCHLYHSKCCIAVCSGPYASGLNYDFLLVDKIFKKCRTASENHEKSEGNVRSCVDSTLDSKNTVRIHYSIVGQLFSDSIQRLFSYLQNCSF